MPVDNSIYFQQQAPDVFGSIERGMRLGDLARQRKIADQQMAENQAVKDAYSKSMTTGPDGQPTLNQGRLVSELYKRGYGQKAYEAGRQLKAQSLEDQANELKSHEMTGREIGQRALSVNDQNSWTAFRNEGIAKKWFEPNAIPEQFDPKVRDATAGRALTAAEYFAKTQKDRGLDQEDRKLKIEQQKADAEKRASGENLSIDVKKFVDTLATKNANKVAIKNQIDAVLGNWDTMSDDQKVAAGRQLLKTLNSTEGADAIGAEEAKRLGSKLEFAMGNLFNSNPVQFGRDLSGFKEQAMNVSRSIDQSVKSNQSQIDQAMGRTTPRPSGGKLRVSNGKETFLIEQADLADAQKDGFQVVK